MRGLVLMQSGKVDPGRPLRGGRTGEGRGLEQVTAIERFRRELCRWVRAHNVAKGYATDPARVFAILQERIGETRLSRIGSAYLNGWLETESDSGRGYFVREADRPGRRGGQFAITHQGQGHVAPCWELFVQLADYAWLRTVAERHGQKVRLEDRLMDLTVRAGRRLVLYVEQKTTRAVAKKLLARMRQYGTNGFDLDDPDRGDDALRKAKYLLRVGGHPMYFGLSAVDYSQLFKVEYLDGNRFRLSEDPRALSAPLAEEAAHAEGKVPPRSAVDPLAIEIERLCPEVWISVGSEQTAYNFYCPTGKGDAIVVGVYENGELWTDVAALGPERATRLASELAEHGLVLDVAKKWAFWRAGRARLNVAAVDPVAIAEAVRSAVGPPVGDRPVVAGP
jgi:hypothetical protein